MKVADELAKKALIKGSELFLLEDSKAQAYGIENLEAYVANGETFKSVLTQKEKTEQFLQDMDLQIERLTSPYLNKDLRAFLKRIEDYELKNLPFLDWLLYLRNKAKESLELDLTDPTNQIDWPMLLRIYKLREFESKIDLNQFAKEKAEFLKKISRIPKETFQEVEKLLSAPLSQNQLPDPETGLLFERMVSHLPPDFDYKAYPNVNYFIGHLILQSELKGERLFEEMTHLTDKISQKLAKTEEEKKIFSLLKDHRLLKRLFALELTPEDYEKMTLPSPLSSPPAGGRGSFEVRGEIRPSQLIHRFVILNRSKRVRNLEFKHLHEIDSLFGQALEFYRGVKERDGGMLQNIEARLKETGADKAVVITGGFHAEPFKEFFQGKGYNYALVAPKITSTEGKEAYIAASLQNSPTQFIRATRESPFPYALPLNKAEQEKVDAAWALDQLICSELHVVDEAGKITEINELANGSPASRNFGLTYRSPAKGPQGKEGVIVTIGNQETFIPFGGTRIIKTVIEEERPTLDLTKGVSRRATTPSIRSEVRMGDILGARKDPTPYPLPQPTEAIPADLLQLQEAEKRLKEYFPALYPYYEQVKRKYFGDFMSGAAGIFEMEGEKTFLLEKHYWNYAAGFLPDSVPALLIYLHLVHELTKLALTPANEPLGLDLNRELIAFIAQTAAYDRLTREEKEHLRNVASFLARSRRPTKGQPAGCPSAGRLP